MGGFDHPGHVFNAQRPEDATQPESPHGGCTEQIKSERHQASHLSFQPQSAIDNGGQQKQSQHCQTGATGTEFPLQTFPLSLKAGQAFV